MFTPKLSRNTLLLSSLIVMMGVGPTAVSAAQDDQGVAERAPLHVAQSSEQQSTDFSDEKIESFVAARESVVEISRKWEERLSNTESQEELNSLQQQAQEEMVEAVRDEGISVNEYNMIVDATQTDPDLLERVNELMTQ